jgi:predicted nucleic acid-binding protein
MNENSAILDSSFLIGHLDRSDVWHSRTREISRTGKIAGIVLDCVLNEVTSVLGRRAEQKGKAKEYRLLLETILRDIPEEKIVWTYPTVPRFYREILDLMQEYKGALSFHDCLIVLTAREKDVRKIVSFDEDFDRVPWVERISS